MRILLVEDDGRLTDALARGFSAEGIAADVESSGADALWRGAVKSRSS